MAQLLNCSAASFVSPPHGGGSEVLADLSASQIALSVPSKVAQSRPSMQALSLLTA